MSGAVGSGVGPPVVSGAVGSGVGPPVVSGAVGSGVGPPVGAGITAAAHVGFHCYFLAWIVRIQAVACVALARGIVLDTKGLTDMPAVVAHPVTAIVHGIHPTHLVISCGITSVRE